MFNNTSYRWMLSMAAAAIGLAGCATSSGPVVIESENQDSRVAVVVLHFTVSDFADSMHVLTKRTSRPVSSHYLIPEPNDDSYLDEKLEVYQLVDEDRRAWHAGVGSWRGMQKLNNMSVGIEIVNQAHCHEAADDAEVTTPSVADWASERICFYPDFDVRQMTLVAETVKGILERHPDVPPTHIIAHSDLAPQRKIDPGPRFPWQWLYQQGIGAWYDTDTVARYWDQFRLEMPGIGRLQEALETYGYEIERSGEYDEQTRNVLSAFQMHFLPWEVTGQPSPATAAVLFALIEKYNESDLAPLLVPEPAIPPVPEAGTEPAPGSDTPAPVAPDAD